MAQPLIAERSDAPYFTSHVGGHGEGDRAAIEHAFFLDHARTLARQNPEHLAALGMTAEEYARCLTEPSLTIEESVAAGWMSAAEGRFILGQATMDDLVALGHPPAEAHAILLDQEDRACASST